MTSSEAGTLIAARDHGWKKVLPGWINVVTASLAMTATLPGRTHGLGLITEPMLSDLSLGRPEFARINLLTSLAGAAFCLPAGWLIDRYGARHVLAIITLGLGLAVVAMSGVTTPGGLAVWLLLVRGLGQSALSLAAMSLISRWFGRGVGVAMGAFAVLLTIGFIASVLATGAAVEAGWRPAWRNLGWIIAAGSMGFWLLARDPARSLSTDCLEKGAGADSLRIPARRDETAPNRGGSPTTPEASLSLGEAMRLPAFWVLVGGASLFNLVWSGITLFNESILAEQRLDAKIAVQGMAILTGIGLVSNLLGGALASRRRVLVLLGAGLASLALGLLSLSLIGGMAGARVYSLATGLSGGLITVVFFCAWRQLFGERHLGRIQGVAQFATVIASALGPVLMAEVHARTGSYKPVFFGLAAAALAVGLIALAVPVRQRQDALPS